MTEVNSFPTEGYSDVFGPVCSRVFLLKTSAPVKKCTQYSLSDIFTEETYF